ncbi:MAG: DUF3868 domain-containing protein [Mediterranea sp.]|jgi:outer membrane protein OmpA-like peptidoglycan-associated protein|nr:DUF3868 domain-containing protein [Mediterranea sp.]
MKKNILLSILVSWMVAASLPAQEIGYQGKVGIKAQEAIHKGDSVYLRMEVKTQGLSMESDRSLTLTPVVRKGDNNKMFTSVLINGKQRQKLYQRSRKLGQIAPSGYLVVPDKGDKWNLGSVTYHSAIPYEEWMKDASIELQEELCGCGGHSQQISVERLVDQIASEKIVTEYQVRPQVAFVHPQSETVKKRSTSYDAYLYFQVGTSAIQPSYQQNAVALDKVERFIGDLRADGNLTLASVSVKGSASLDGNEQGNRQLSDRRASALLHYLIDKGNLPADKASILPGGEDWERFEQLIDKTPELLNYRAQLHEVSSLPVSADQKEARIKALEGGKVYQTLGQYVFPQMRRVVCRVDYQVRSFGIEESKQVYATHPQQLSLEELFALVNSYGEGQPQFGEIFETAVRLYPDDKTANLNAAASYLQQGNAERAKNYLPKADPTTAEYLNDLGVYHLLKGEYEEAATWFGQAIAKGSTQAVHNKAELQKKLESLGNFHKK